MSNSSEHALLHRQETRFAYYAEHGHLEWSTTLQCWLVYDLDLVLEVLKSRAFLAEDSVEESRMVSRGLKIDLSSTQMIFDKVPLALEGDQHAELRRQMAVEITGHAAAALQKVSEFAASAVPKFFAQREVFNIVECLFQPAVSIMMQELAGICLVDQLQDASPTQIFDRQLGASRRKIIEQKIKEIYAVALETYSPEIAKMRVAMMLVGSDSMLGALAESFVYDVRRNGEEPLDLMHWSSKIPITSIPYVERIAKSDISLGGNMILNGQRIRVYLDAFKSTDDRENDIYFGAGRHVCLGKAVSQNMWSIFVEQFKKINRRCNIVDVKYRRVDFLFNLPAHVGVKLT